MDSKGNAKLGDFGNCIHLKENETAECRVGSFDYLPPEAATARIINFSFDYWSFGVCIFQMMIGKLPFEKREQIEVYNNLLYISRDDNEKLEPARQLVLNLLRKDPVERMTFSKKLKENQFFNKIDWNRLENGELKPPITPHIIVFYLFSNISIHIIIYSFMFFQKRIIILINSQILAQTTQKKS